MTTANLPFYASTTLMMTHLQMREHAHPNGEHFFVDATVRNCGLLIGTHILVNEPPVSAHGMIALLQRGLVL